MRRKDRLSVVFRLGGLIDMICAGKWAIGLNFGVYR